MPTLMQQDNRKLEQVRLLQGGAIVLRCCLAEATREVIQIPGDQPAQQPL